MFARPDASEKPRLRLATLFADRDPEERLSRLDRADGDAVDGDVGRGGSDDSAEPADDARACSAARNAAADRAGRLAERWVPGGGRSVGLLRMFVRNHRAKLLAAAAVALACVLVVLGVRTAAPRSEAAPPLPAAVSSLVPATDTTAAAPSDAPIVVSVVGKVADAGLVTLTRGARVADAIAAAGGRTSEATVTGVNLAREVSDGEQIYVGIPAPPKPAPSAGSGPVGAARAHGKIDINTATAAQLDTLPGVGPATAKKILQWRKKHGRFKTVNQLRDVRGIGDAKLADMRDMVTVG